MWFKFTDYISARNSYVQNIECAQSCMIEALNFEDHRFHRRQLRKDFCNFIFSVHVYPSYGMYHDTGNFKHENVTIASLCDCRIHEIYIP